MKNVKVTNIVLALGLCAAAIAMFATNSRLSAAGSSGLISKTAPKWELPGLDGKKVQLSDFAGKVVILDFWATWCGPCKMEIPGFIELQKKYAKQGLVVIGVSLDQGGADVVKAFTKKEGMNYPVVMGDAKVSKAYGDIEAIPTTFIIDRTGKIVAQHVGYTEKAEFESAIKPLLEK